MAVRRIRKGDQVVVITGRDRGRKGEVLRVLREEERVIVRGVAVVKRHRRPSQSNPQGGIDEKESAVHVSNVALMDSETGQATRVGRARGRDGAWERVSRRSGRRIG